MLFSRKRILLPVICLCLLCFGLTGCQSRDAAAAEKLIEALDIETPDGDAVRAAREACDALSEEERQSLENYGRLAEAEARYQAKTVDGLIGAVGDVTLESGPAIEAAREAYDALSSAARERVEHTSALTAAEEEFRRLSVEHAAARIDSLIDAIGEVTLESRDAVAAARAALESADGEVLAAVRSQETFEQAEEELRRLEVQQAAEEFDASVGALGEITPESRGAVEEARAAYKELDEEVKALVGTLSVLEAAEDRLVYLDNLAKAQEMDAAVAGLGEITLESEDSVKEIRKQLDALPDEVRELTKSSKALSEAEATIQTLKDKTAAAEVKRLSDEKQYDEAISYAETYMQGRPISEVKGGVVKNCLKAYASKANALMKGSRNEEAYELLSGCRKTYADADLTDVNKSWDSLKKAIAEPKSGQVFSSAARGGYCTLTVETSDFPAFIKVVNTKDPKSVVSFYVRANSKSKISIKNGTYEVRFATGDKWFGSGELFGKETRYQVFDDTLSFTTKNNGSYINYTTWSVTLYSVPGGTATTTTIPADKF